MDAKKSIYSTLRHSFHFFYTFIVIIITLYLAIVLQAGPAGPYLFFRNDLLTYPQRLIFVLGFPVAYLVSVLACGYLLKLPRYDFFNKILAINIITYSFLGLSFSALRLPLFSREVFLFEFFLTSSLLVAFHILRHRLFPKHLGVMPEVDIDPFRHYPSLKAFPVDAELIQHHQFDGIVIHLRESVDSSTSHLLADLAQKRIPVHDANTLLEALWGRIPLSELSPAKLKTFTTPKIYSQIKRASEVILIIMFAPLLVVLALLASIIVKIDSPGPVLFRQPRTGLNGSSFIMFKFRSMHTTDTHTNRFAKVKDSRLTGVGSRLRRHHIDELPQLWNVLRGDMSLIGPRPEQLEFTKRFEQLIPFYGFRHTVRPGITGWSQVMYGYANSDQQTKEKLEFDLFYIKNMSLWLDLVVLVKTLRTMILGSRVR